MMENFLISLLSSLLASATVLYIDKLRLPSLQIKTDNSANITNNYANNGKGKWKFIRVLVRNQKFPFIFSWLVRQTAENCNAKITFRNMADELLFTMNGRWTNTPELIYLPKDEWIKSILFHEPIAIHVNEEQILDLVAMQEGSNEAFGWNNEAYLNDWKTPKYRLSQGKYKIEININTQNGVSFTKTTNLEIGNNIDSSFLLDIK